MAIDDNDITAGIHEFMQLPQAAVADRLSQIRDVLWMADNPRREFAARILMVLLARMPDADLCRIVNDTSVCDPFVRAAWYLSARLIDSDPLDALDHRD